MVDTVEEPEVSRHISGTFANGLSFWTGLGLQAQRSCQRSQDYCMMTRAPGFPKDKEAHSSHQHGQGQKPKDISPAAVAGDTTLASYLVKSATRDVLHDPESVWLWPFPATMYHKTGAGKHPGEGPASWMPQCVHNSCEPFPRAFLRCTHTFRLAMHICIHAPSKDSGKR